MTACVFFQPKMYVFMYTQIYITGYIHPEKITETYVVFYSDIYSKNK